MPADSEQVSLPRTWRPLGVTLAVVGFGLMFLVVGAFAWFGMDPENRARFSALQKITIIVLILGAGWGAWVLGRCRVSATESGMVVVNGQRKTTYPWAEISGVMLQDGMPWARLSLRNGEVRQLVGLQASDGMRTSSAVEQLQRLVRERSGA